MLELENLITLFVTSGIPAIVTYSRFYEKTIGFYLQKLVKRRFYFLDNMFICPLCFGFIFGVISYPIFFAFSFKYLLAYATLNSISAFVLYTLFDFLENK